MKLSEILAKPEVGKLYWKLLGSLTGESGRGTLLVATTYVDEELKKLVQAILSPNSTSDFKKGLFNGHGPLNTFSGKIEICYAFRLIDRKLHTCLHALRKIRNEAAHSLTSLELVELNEKMKAVYDFGPGFTNHIRNVAMTAMLEDKIEQAAGILDTLDIEDSEKAEFLKDAFAKKSNEMENQLPHWELVFGLMCLCGLIINHRDNLVNVVKDINVWGELYKPQPEQTDPA